VGAGVTAFKAGDRVYTSGPSGGAWNGVAAELAVRTADQVHPLPAALSFSQGAAIGVPYGTAFRALVHRASAKAGETVLVHGASGGVGIAAVQLGRTRGLTVIATAGTERGRALVLEQGAHHAFDHGKAGYLDEVRALAGGRGVDVILEMLANVNLGKDLGALAPRGRVVVIGSRGTVEINPRDAMMRDASIHGMALANASPAEKAEIYAALGAGFESGALRPVVAKEFPLRDAAAAHEAVMAAGHLGKIVLVV
jgi:NADPH2:quinone reductase